MANYFITGGTGFVGSHVAEAAVRRGHRVRCLARSSADVSFLKSVGAEIVPGDLSDPTGLADALAGTDVVVHSAAKVGDWGHVDEYRKVNVDGLRHLLEAASALSLSRFVHLSSLGVYAARHHYGTDESEPLPEAHIDGYTQSKVEAETLALKYHCERKVPVTILRPGFIYGPRDRNVLPKLVDQLREGWIVYIARGRYALNTTYVGNLVEAVMLAAEHPAAVGEIFNITDGEFVSKRRFFEGIADGLSLPRPKRNIPLFLGKFLAKWREAVFRKKNKPHPPRITQAKLKFAGLNLDFGIGKARTTLGYAPPTSFADGLAAALDWYKASK